MHYYAFPPFNVTESFLNWTIIHVSEKRYRSRWRIISSNRYVANMQVCHRFNDTFVFLVNVILKTATQLNVL